VNLSASPLAESATQESTPQPVDVDDHALIGLLHFRYGMGLQAQLLSKKCFDEHLDPLPLGAYTSALKELDESGIHASRLACKSLPHKHLNFNHTFWRGAEKWDAIEIEHIP
jgi:hypothetical protein